MNTYHIPRYITSNNDTDLHTTSKTQPISKPYSPALVAKRIATLESLIIQVTSSEITPILTTVCYPPIPNQPLKRPPNPLIFFRFKQFCFSATILYQYIILPENRLCLARTSLLSSRHSSDCFGFSYTY